MNQKSAHTFARIPVRERGRGGGLRHVYIETYGCQMNANDSEIIASILEGQGYTITSDPRLADLILVNTCAVRDKAEQTVRNRLKQFKSIKRHNPDLKVGLVGCMAERLKDKLLEEEELVDLVAGPDAYRQLPAMIKDLEDGRKAVNVLLSLEETYDDIEPVHIMSNGISAFVSITRGCDNMCTFCVVPYTRGRERSRNPETILREIARLRDKGFKEVTLLGQNVDSYLWYGGGPKKEFYKQPPEVRASAVDFAELLDRVAAAFPDMRIRFTTSNPQDMTDRVIDVIARHPNVGRYIHLPFQSGSNRILRRMNRQYTREQYLDLIRRIRERIPDIALSHDVIAGFPGETEEDHAQTLSLMDEVVFDFGYMFAYSERPGTAAARLYEDDVPRGIKIRRLNEIIAKQNAHSKARMKNYVGRTFEVLIEGNSKKSDAHWMGRTLQNAVVVFPKTGKEKPGDFVNVHIEDTTGATLLGKRV
ncbi:MAG: tRNA (N6-isopentenyl adenosine(37)-C2)-methylthiotransferase MiaB [Chlorobi bacterium]|nr:tRNA (N6-isopentenyl adenosine(37)-C2)-methylthiotransferase MiaB [Chlorobiota bacterium]